jgi:transposase
VANTEIAERLGISRPTVIAWRKRYAHQGLTGQLADLPRRGRPQTVRRDRRAEILATTLAPPPQQLGVTHWSSRLLATQLGISHSTVARVWAEHDIRPWQTETFKFSTDPELEAKVRDVVGLYLDPPAHAIVLCVDEKSQIQALERTQPVRPVAPGRVERRTHDYVRHGTTTLFAALEVATGQLTDACHPRHRHGEFLAFLRLVARAYPRRQLHVVVDNYATHKHERVKAWLAKHRRVQLHFTPTYASWLNLVEVFFSITQRQGLRRGDFASVEELVAAIGRFCDGWNQRCQPFAWSKDAEQIVGRLKRQTTWPGTVRA